MKKIIYTIALFSIFMISCNSNKSEEQNTKDAENNTETNIVEFTTEQMKVAGIKLGKLSNIEMAKEIVCTGVVEANPENIAKVSVPVSAFIDEIKVKHGEYVKKGNTILVLKHTDFVDLQSNYMRVKNELEFKTEEFNRQKKLFEENAVSKKKFNEVKLEYNSIIIEKNSLEQKLLLLGINPKSLTAENISSTIELKAPFSGYIDEININLGQFVEPKDVLFEMVDPTNFNIMLDVYSKYKHLVKKGEKVVFRLCSTDCDTLHATIYSVGQLIDNHTKTFKVHAKPNKENSQLTAGAYINAKILVDNSMVLALPKSAVIINSKGNFVFIQNEKNIFELIEVEIGESNNEFVEIISVDKFKGKKIVIEGSNYLYSEIN